MKWERKPLQRRKNSYRKQGQQKWEGVVGTELLKWGNNILKKRPLKYRKPYSTDERALEPLGKCQQKPLESPLKQSWVPKKGETSRSPEKLITLWEEGRRLEQRPLEAHTDSTSVRSLAKQS